MWRSPIQSRWESGGFMKPARFPEPAQGQGAFRPMAFSLDLYLDIDHLRYSEKIERSTAVLLRLTRKNFRRKRRLQPWPQPTLTSAFGSQSPILRQSRSAARSTSNSSLGWLRAP